MVDTLTFWSVDPGIENTSAVCLRIDEDCNVEILHSYEFNLKGEDCENENPLDIVKTKKTQYVEHLTEVLHDRGVDEIVKTLDDDTIFVFEENDNKYTRHIAPILSGMFYKKGRTIHVVKPVNVWNGMKRGMGWLKGDHTTRPEKKLKTRNFIAKYVENSFEENSDDTNDAILNAMYMAKKLRLFKKKK